MDIPEKNAFVFPLKFNILIENLNDEEVGELLEMFFDFHEKGDVVASDSQDVNVVFGRYKGYFRQNLKLYSEKCAENNKGV